MKMIAGVLSLLMLAAALPGQKSPIPSEAEFKKAKEKLEADPQDPVANTTAGTYLAFGQGDYAAALPFLVLSGDKTLKSLADHELDPSYIDTAVKKVGMGDDWIGAIKKLPGLTKPLQDRGTYWYGQAWNALDGPWRDRTRAQLRKVLQNPTVGDPKALLAPTPWKLSDMAQKGSATQKASHTGRACYQVAVQKTTAALSIALQQDVMPIPGSSCDFSAWALPDGTDGAGDQVAVTIFVQGGKPVAVHRLFVPADEPWWHHVSMKFEMPKDAVILWVQIATASKQGNLFVDDISLKADGRETVKNGSFEDK